MGCTDGDFGHELPRVPAGWWSPPLLPLLFGQALSLDRRPSHGAAAPITASSRQLRRSVAPTLCPPPNPCARGVHTARTGPALCVLCDSSDPPASSRASRPSFTRHRRL